MKVLKKNVYKGYTVICHSHSESKTISSLHERNIVLIKLNDGSYVELKYLIATQGRFKDAAPRLPKYHTRPNRSGEIYVDERCIKAIYEDIEENEKIDVNDIEQAEVSATL